MQNGGNPHLIVSREYAVLQVINLKKKKKKEERKKGLHELFKSLLVGCYWGSIKKNRKGMALEEMAKHCGNTG